MTRPEDLTTFVNLLWVAALQGQSRPHEVLHRRACVAPRLLESVPALITEGRPPERQVALIDGANFQRESEAAAIEDAYRQKPRTLVYEHAAFYGGIIQLATMRLAELWRKPVACSAYESRPASTSFGAHVDDWLGLVVQVDGRKTWRVWQRDGVVQLTTSAGDILAIPRNVKHDVSTPDTPGHSLHLTFALMEAA